MPARTAMADREEEDLCRFHTAIEEKTEGEAKEIKEKYVYFRGR